MGHFHPFSRAMLNNQRVPIVECNTKVCMSFVAWVKSANFGFSWFFCAWSNPYHPESLVLNMAFQLVISPEKLPQNSSLVGGFKHDLYFPKYIYGMSSFPLTFTPSFFKMVKLHHQPAPTVGNFSQVGSKLLEAPPSALTQHTFTRRQAAVRSWEGGITGAVMKRG